jgi:hypothetical protein
VWAYTYEIVIRNETGEVIEEEDDDLVIDEIKATMNDGLT